MLRLWGTAGDAVFASANTRVAGSSEPTHVASECVVVGASDIITIPY